MDTSRLGARSLRHGPVNRELKSFGNRDQIEAKSKADESRLSTRQADRRRDVHDTAGTTYRLREVPVQPSSPIGAIHMGEPSRRVLN